MFWIGDLNYRIDMPDEQVRVLCAQEQWDELYAHDQLRHQIRAGLAFEAWLEEPLRFAPTYKYDPGTTNYDSSEKNRIPAWCDRVLHKRASQLLLFCFLSFSVDSPRV